MLCFSIVVEMKFNKHRSKTALISVLHIGYRTFKVTNPSTVRQSLLASTGQDQHILGETTEWRSVLLPKAFVCINESNYGMQRGRLHDIGYIKYGVKIGGCMIIYLPIQSVVEVFLWCIIVLNKCFVF